MKPAAGREQLRSSLPVCHVHSPGTPAARAGPGGFFKRILMCSRGRHRDESVGALVPGELKLDSP